MYTHGVGEHVAIQVRRGARTLTARVPIVEREDHTARLAAIVAGKQPIDALGIVALDLTPPIAELLGPLRQPRGVVVVRTTPEALYSQQGTLESGDVIHAINGQDVASLDALKAALAAVKMGSPIVLQVERDGALMYLGFRAQR